MHGGPLAQIPEQNEGNIYMFLRTTEYRRFYRKSSAKEGVGRNISGRIGVGLVEKMFSKPCLITILEYQHVQRLVEGFSTAMAGG